MRQSVLKLKYQVIQELEKGNNKKAIARQFGITPNQVRNNENQKREIKDRILKYNITYKKTNNLFKEEEQVIQLNIQSFIQQLIDHLQKSLEVKTCYNIDKAGVQIDICNNTTLTQIGSKSVQLLKSINKESQQQENLINLHNFQYFITIKQEKINYYYFKQYTTGKLQPIYLTANQKFEYKVRILKIDRKSFINIVDQVWYEINPDLIVKGFNKIKDICISYQNEFSNQVSSVIQKKKINYKSQMEIEFEQQDMEQEQNHNDISRNIEIEVKNYQFDDEDYLKDLIIKSQTSIYDFDSKGPKKIQNKIKIPNQKQILITQMQYCKKFKQLRLIQICWNSIRKYYSQFIPYIGVQFDIQQKFQILASIINIISQVNNPNTVQMQEIQQNFQDFIKNKFFNCQIHNQKCTHLYLEINNSEQTSPFKCPKCSTQFLLDPTKILSLEDIFTCKDEATILDNWPLFGQKNYIFTKASQIKQINFEETFTFFKGYKASIIDKLEKIEEKLKSQYKIIENNKKLLKDYYNTVSLKQYLYNALHQIPKNPEQSQNLIKQIIQEVQGNRQNIESQINYIYKTLSFYQDYLSTYSLKQFTSPIENILNKMQIVINYEIFDVLESQQNKIAVPKQQKEFWKNQIKSEQQNNCLNMNLYD
ncbi:hypothetical protein ABPG74_016155 [Tetrahymena malaccensis]